MPAIETVYAAVTLLDETLRRRSGGIQGSGIRVPESARS
jgi:hypothetical protein